MKRVVPTEDFLRPWKPRSGCRSKRRRETKTSLVTEQETRASSEGLLDSSCMCSCHGDILRDRLLLTGASLCVGFAGDQSLFYE